MKSLWFLFIVFCSCFMALNAIDFPWPDYYVNHGFDFANGKYVTAKAVDENGKQKIIWTRYSEDSGFEDVYRKYALGYYKPLLHFGFGTGYQSNYFIRVQTYNRGWKFWRWNWYFFTDVPSMCWDGSVQELALLRFLQQNDVSPEIAHEWYDGCVKRFNDHEALGKYIANSMDEYEKESLLKKISKIIVTGDRKLYEKITPQRVGRMIQKYRETFPEQLPDAFLILATEQDPYYRLDFDSSKSGFLLQEYLCHPAEKNARYLLSAYAAELSDQENCLDLSWLFQALNEKGLLKKFVSQLNLSGKKFPPLPMPIRKPKSALYLTNVYYTDTYAGLPERENLLLISCNPHLFKKVASPLENPIFNPNDFFAEFQIRADTVLFKLKADSARFQVILQNEREKIEYGQRFTLKQGESLVLNDGRHLSLNLTFLSKERLNEEQKWLCRKAGYPGENVLVVTEYFNLESFGRNQVEIQDSLILPYWQELENTASRIIFLRINKSANYAVLSRNRPVSVLNAIPMNTNSYEDVLLRIKDSLEKTLMEISPFPTPQNSFLPTQVFQLSDHPDEKVFMQHYFEFKDVFSIEVTPNPGLRSNIEIQILGVEDRSMFIYTKYNPAVTMEFQRKIKQILTPEFLLIPKK